MTWLYLVSEACCIRSLLFVETNWIYILYMSIGKYTLNIEVLLWSCYIIIVVRIDLELEEMV